MGAFKVSDPELEYRRQLLKDARKGNAAAEEELKREFHVWTYSAAERAKLHYTAMPTNKRCRYQNGR
jgi:hypothetical protein